MPTTDATWNSDMSQAYDRGLGPVLFEPYARQLAALARGLKPKRVLELAAGTGIVTSALLQALPKAAVTATDLNKAMVDYARERVPGASWQTADAQELPFPEASFDLVVCQFGVMFFPDKPAAFAEMARVLTPGGTVLLAIWDSVKHSRLEAAVMASVTALMPDDPPTFLVRIPHGYTDTEQMRSDITAGGLEVLAIDRVVETGTAPSAASFAEGFCHGTPLRFALEQRGSLPELTAAVVREMTGRLGEGPVSGEMAAFVVTARNP